MACAQTGRTGRQSAHPAELARLRTRPWPMDRPGPPTPASGSTSARRRRWRWVGPSATTGVRAALVDARLVRSVRWRAVIIWRCDITNLESKNITSDTGSRPRFPSDGAALPVRPIEYGPLAAATRVALVRRADKPREPDHDWVKRRAQGVGRKPLSRWTWWSSLPFAGMVASLPCSTDGRVAGRRGRRPPQFVKIRVYPIFSEA